MTKIKLESRLWKWTEYSPRYLCYMETIVHVCTHSTGPETASTPRKVQQPHAASIVTILVLSWRPTKFRAHHLFPHSSLLGLILKFKLE